MEQKKKTTKDTLSTRWVYYHHHHLQQQQQQQHHQREPTYKACWLVRCARFTRAHEWIVAIAQNMYNNNQHMHNIDREINQHSFRFCFAFWAVRSCGRIFTYINNYIYIHTCRQRSMFISLRVCELERWTKWNSRPRRRQALARQL